MPTPLRLVPLVLLAALLAPARPARARTSDAAQSVPPSAPVPADAPKPEWTVTLEDDTPVEGVELPEGTVLHYQPGDWPPPQRGPDGHLVAFFGPPAPVLVRAVPSADIEAWGLPIAAGEDLFLGSFVSLVLDGEGTVQGLPLEAGTIVEFERTRGPDDDQASAIKVLRGCTLSRAATVQGVQIPGNAALEFRPRGKLWLVRLYDDDDLAGFPVSSSADAEFHRNGRLSRFRLSRDFLIGGHTCEQDEDVDLYPSGHLEGCELAPGELAQGLAPDDDRPTRFFDSGLVQSIALTQAATVDGMALQPGAILDFHPNGRVRRLRSGFAQDPERPREKRFVTQVVRGIPLEPNLGDTDHDGAYFRRDGSLEKVVTRDDFEYEGIPVAGGPDPVEFWVSGRIKSARLARDFAFRGRTYRRGMPIRLRRDGSLAFR